MSWWRDPKRECSLAKAMRSRGALIIEPEDVPEGWGYGIDMARIGEVAGPGRVTVCSDGYVCADGAGWLPAVFDTVAEAVDAVRNARS